MKEICCPAMKDAIDRGVVTWPIIYTMGKGMRRLTPTIKGAKENTMTTLLNYCPWCKKQVNPNIKKGTQHKRRSGRGVGP